VPPPRAAESKWRQSGRQNEYYRPMVPRMCSTDPSDELPGDPWDYLGDPVVNVSIILKWMLNIRVYGFESVMKSSGSE